jgi:hypothetical protein
LCKEIAERLKRNILDKVFIDSDCANKSPKDYKNIFWIKDSQPIKIAQRYRRRIIKILRKSIVRIVPWRN